MRTLHLSFFWEETQFSLKHGLFLAGLLVQVASLLIFLQRWDPWIRKDTREGGESRERRDGLGSPSHKGMPSGNALPFSPSSRGQILGM